MKSLILLTIFGAAFAQFEPGTFYCGEDQHIFIDLGDRESTIITSRNYLENYPTYTCDDWIITVPPGKVVQMVPMDFQVIINSP